MENLIDKFKLFIKENSDIDTIFIDSFYDTVNKYNKIINIQEDKYNIDINKYRNKEIVYLIYIKDTIYKFGITKNIIKRIANHNRLLKHKYIVKLWDCLNGTISKNVEDDIKQYLKANNLNCSYEGQTEIINTNNIEKIIKIFDNYVVHRVSEYKELYNDRKIEQQLILMDKVIEMEKIQLEKLNKQLEIIEKSYNNLTNNKLQININQTDFEVNDIIKQVSNIDLSKVEKDIIDDDIEMELNEHKDSVIKCGKCKQDKPKRDYFKENKENQGDEFFSHCITCRTNAKKYDRQRPKKTKPEQCQEFYKKNKLEIINQKKHYRFNRIKNNTDPNTTYCRKCNTFKSNDKFEINNKTNKQYMQCFDCRMKTKPKNIIIE